MSEVSGVDVLAVMKAAYAIDGGYATWRDAVIEALGRLIPVSRTATWFEYDFHFDEQGLAFDGVHAAFVLGNDAADTWSTARDRLPSDLRTLLFGRTGAATSSHASGLGTETRNAPAFRYLWREPVVDSFGMVAADPSGRGVCVSLGLTEERSLSIAEQRIVSRLAAHFAAGHRLRGARSDRATHRSGRRRVLAEREAVACDARGAATQGAARRRASSP